MSQEQLAEQLGVDRTTIIRWELGRNGPHPWQRPNSAMALKVSVEELAHLLGDTDGEQAAQAVFISIPQGTEMRWRTVDPELLTHCKTLTDTYRQLDYQAGSRAVYCDVVTQLGHMLALTDSVPSPLYQQFIRALGDTRNWPLGWPSTTRTTPRPGTTLRSLYPAPKRVKTPRSTPMCLAS